MKAKAFSDTFWKQFQNAVSTNNKKEVVKLSYFLSEDDKKYFLEIYREIFDDIAIVAITSSKYTALKAVTQNLKSPGIGPFELLILPESMKTVYILNVVYSKIDQSEEEYYSEDEDEFLDDYGKEDDFGFDEDKYEDFEFDGDEVIELVKAFVFGEIKGEFKFLGTYSVD